MERNTEERKNVMDKTCQVVYPIDKNANHW